MLKFKVRTRFYGFLLCLVLSCALVFGLSTTSARAVVNGGGTAYYEVSDLNLGDFVMLGKQPSGNFPDEPDNMMRWRIVDKDATNGLLLKLDVTLPAMRMDYGQKEVNGVKHPWNVNGSTVFKAGGGYHNQQRQSTGTNFWYQTDMRDYLNGRMTDSDYGADKDYHWATNAGQTSNRKQTRYNEESFAARFSDEEWAMINTVEQEQLLSWVDFYNGAANQEGLYHAKYGISSGTDVTSDNVIVSEVVGVLKGSTGTATNGNLGYFRTSAGTVSVEEYAYNVNYSSTSGDAANLATNGEAAKYMMKDKVFLADLFQIITMHSDSVGKNQKGDSYDVAIDASGNKVDTWTRVPQATTLAGLNNHPTNFLRKYQSYKMTGNSGYDSSSQAVSPMVWLSNSAKFTQRQSADKRPNETKDYFKYYIDATQTFNTSNPPSMVYKQPFNYKLGRYDTVIANYSPSVAFNKIAGVTLDEQTGIISGTPTKAVDSWTGDIVIKNNAGSTTKNFTFTVQQADVKASSFTITAQPNVPLSTVPFGSGWSVLDNDNKPVDGTWTWQNGSKNTSGADTQMSEKADFTPTDTGYKKATGIDIKLDIVAYGPDYVAPKALKAIYGDTLKDVKFLDDNDKPLDKLKWQDESISVGVVGNATEFVAEFQSSDAAFTNVVEFKYTIQVDKAKAEVHPDYNGGNVAEITVPYNTALSGVGLPSGWRWVEGEEEKLGDVNNGNNGVVKRKAIFNPDSANYLDSVSSEVSLKIIPIDSVPNIPQGLELEYGKTLQDMFLGDGWTWNNPTQGIGNAGNSANYKASFKQDESGNYNAVTEIDIKITTIKADAIPNDSTLEKEFTIEFSKTLSTIVDQLLPNWRWENPNERGGNAGGIKTVNALYNPDTANYNDYIGSVSLKTIPTDALPPKEPPTEVELLAGKILAATINLGEGFRWSSEDEGYKGEDGDSKVCVAIYSNNDSLNYNEKKYDIKVKVVKSLTPPPPPPGGEEPNNDWILFVAIGGGVALLIALIVIIVVIKKKKKPVMATFTPTGYANTNTAKPQSGYGQRPPQSRPPQNYNAYGQRPQQRPQNNQPNNPYNNSNPYNKNNPYNKKK